MRIVLALAVVLSLVGVLAGQQASKTVTIDKMTFADKALGARVRGLYLAAEKFAGSKWDRRPFDSFPELRVHSVHHAEWCSLADDDKGGPLNYHGPKELHHVSFQAYYEADKADPDAHLKIVGTIVGARWKPADSGWGAYLTYMSFRGKPRPGIASPVDSFYGFWNHYPKAKEKPLPRIDWDPQFMMTFTFGEKAERTAYTIGVTADPPRKRKPRDEEVRAILASPASLRDHFVRAHADLLKRVTTEVQAGRGLYSAYYESVPPGLDGKARERVNSVRLLTNDDREAIIKAAKVELEGKNAVIEAHYKELHAAVQKTFPFRECFAAK